MGKRGLTRCGLLAAALAGSAAIASPAAGQASQFVWADRGNIHEAIHATVNAWAARNGVDPAHAMTQVRNWLGYAFPSSDPYYTEILYRLAKETDFWRGSFPLFKKYPLKPEGNWNYGDWKGSDLQLPLYGVECDEYEYKVDRFGNPHAPTRPMVGSGDIKNPENTFRSMLVGEKQYEMADSRVAAALWSVHHLNVGRTEDQFCYFFTVTSGEVWQGFCPPYLDLTGQYQDFSTIQATTIYNSLHWSTYGQNEGTRDCPPDGASDEIDFYSFSSTEGNEGLRKQDGCTYYIKNYDLGPTGYAYPITGPVKSSNGLRIAMLNNPQAALCVMSNEAIAAMVQFMLEKADDQFNTIPLPDVVLPSDVRTTNGEPIAGESFFWGQPKSGLGSYGAPSSPATPQEPAAPNDYVPPTRPSGGGGAGGDGSDPDPGTGTGDGVAIDLTHPDVQPGTFAAPDLEMPEWVPSLPELNIPASSGECPVFGFDAFGERYLMEIHCTLIEPHKTTIASVMVAVFTMLSFFMILRA